MDCYDVYIRNKRRHQKSYRKLALKYHPDKTKVIKLQKKSLKKPAKLSYSLTIREKLIMINLATQHLKAAAEASKVLEVLIVLHSQIFSKIFLATLEVVLQEEPVTEETI